VKHYQYRFLKSALIAVCLVNFLLSCAVHYRETSNSVSEEKSKKVELGSNAPAKVVTPNHESEIEVQNRNDSIKKLCDEIDALYRRNKWAKKSSCHDIKFSVIGNSIKGRPLLSFSYGDMQSDKITLVQCAIHGDELPSLPMCFYLIDEVLSEKRALPKGVKLVVQPLLNPDGMLDGRPQRPNARGVDLNRNFPTTDFEAEAVKSWKTRDREDPRKFPGIESNSEPETQAIVLFIESKRPQKILSIHTPLGHLDLDAKGHEDHERRARFLAINMSKNSGDYTFKSFGFYPGSLGNFAGREKQIPVYTLELPPGDSKPTVDNYWKRFRLALWRAIDFDLDTGQFIED